MTQNSEYDDKLLNDFLDEYYKEKNVQREEEVSKSQREEEVSESQRYAQVDAFNHPFSQATTSYGSSQNTVYNVEQSFSQSSQYTSDSYESSYSQNGNYSQKSELFKNDDKDEENNNN